MRQETCATGGKPYIIVPMNCVITDSCHGVHELLLLVFHVPVSNFLPCTYLRSLCTPFSFLSLCTWHILYSWSCCLLSTLNVCNPFPFWILGCQHQQGMWVGCWLKCQGLQGDSWLIAQGMQASYWLRVHEYPVGCWLRAQGCPAGCWLKDWGCPECCLLKAQKLQVIVTRLRQ